MKKAVKIIICSTFPLYVLLLIYALFLYSRGSYREYFSFSEYIRNCTNILPFRSILLYVNALFTGSMDISSPIANLLGNLLFFLPMGLYLPCLFKRLRRFGGFIICMLCVLLAVEATQLLLRTGSFDIDDVILNIAGAGFGFLIFRKPIKSLFKQREHTAQTEPVTVD